MKIIVTGGAGFIGSHFINIFNKRYPEVEIVVVDKLTYAADINNICAAGFSFIHKDICDLTKKDLGEFEYLINFAAESHVDRSIVDGKPFLKTNVEGVFNLLEICRQNKKLRKFIQISTDEVYGDMDDYDIVEAATLDLPLFPSSYYSATKAAAEMLVLAANKTYGLPYIITRTTNNFGENQHPEKLIPVIIDCVKNKKSIPIYGDGKNIREWIYVKDNINCIIDLLNDEDTEGIYNIGSGDLKSNLDIIADIEQILNKRVDFEFVDDRKGHDKVYSINSDITPGINVSLTLYDYLLKQLLF